MAAFDTEKIFYIAASVASESNYRALAKLKETHITWERAWNALSPEKRRGIEPEALWASLAAEHVRLILFDDAEYPSLLREISSPPFGLYVRGILPGGTQRYLAIVGTRKATEDGAELARQFAAELARSGCVIISGMALGIDAAAHAGCLDARGVTLAVLGNGLDRLYPRTNETLGRNIVASGGALLSEYPPGTPPLPYHFLERNRIVSGMAKAVVVIEAPKESGSLVTARFALEQNRDVFVVPGPARHPNFSGSHQLIRDGAELVTTPADILESLGISPAHSANTNGAETDEEKIIIAALAASPRPLDIDKIIELTHLEAHVVNQAISFLTLKNMIRENREGYRLHNS